MSWEKGELPENAEKFRTVLRELAGKEIISNVPEAFAKVCEACGVAQTMDGRKIVFDGKFASTLITYSVDLENGVIAFYSTQRVTVTFFLKMERMRMAWVWRIYVDIKLL